MKLSLKDLKLWYTELASDLESIVTFSVQRMSACLVYCTLVCGFVFMVLAMYMYVWCTIMCFVNVHTMKFNVQLPLPMAQSNYIYTYSDVQSNFGSVKGSKLTSLVITIMVLEQRPQLQCLIVEFICRTEYYVHANLYH